MPLPPTVTMSPFDASRWPERLPPRYWLANAHAPAALLEAPARVQSWFVLERIRQLAEQAGGSMADVFKLVQYFTDLRDYPLYARVRRLFYPGEPPVSTVVEASGMLPNRQVRVEVEATACIPRQR